MAEYRDPGINAERVIQAEVSNHLLHGGIKEHDRDLDFSWYCVNTTYSILHTLSCAGNCIQIYSYFCPIKTSRAIMPTTEHSPCHIVISHKLKWFAEKRKKNKK